MSDEPFSLSYESLSADCAAPRPGHRGTRDNLDAATVRACLEAFAVIPAVDLADVDAKIRLRHEHRQVVVARSGNALFFTPLPEASNLPVPSTPDGVMAHLTGLEAAQAQPQPAEPTLDQPAEPSAPTKRSLFKLSLGAQLAVLAITASVAAGLLYQVVAAPPPGSYTWIADSDRLKEVQSGLDGDYGDPAVAEGMSFTISGGKLSIYYTPAAKAPRELVRSGSFRLAQREGGVVALIIANGDVLELNPDGSLHFGDRGYPRTGRR